MFFSDKIIQNLLPVPGVTSGRAMQVNADMHEGKIQFYLCVLFICMILKFNDTVALRCLIMFILNEQSSSGL